MALKDGSALYLRGGAAVTELSARHLKLSRGEILLDVVKGAGPFVVEAPHESLRCRAESSVTAAPPRR